MKIVIQRVSQARVEVNDQLLAAINEGMLVLCGFAPEDNEQTLDKMLDKCLRYRIFGDEDGKMNLSLESIRGGLLLVPQFTVMAETRHGLRPGFSSGASPEKGHQLFESLKQKASARYPSVEFGEFGADMQIYLCNDGPVTFIMEF